MRYLFGLLLPILTVLVLTATGSAPASAYVYVWEDPVTKVSMTVPDTWKRMPKGGPDELIAFRAPGQNQHAACRMRVNEDRRYMIYPHGFAGGVRDANFNEDFWNNFGMTEFRAYSLNSTDNNKGMGNGFASMADISFVPQGNMPMNKRGLVWASLYNDKLYMLECSSEEASFQAWYPWFQNIVSTVHFAKELHELPTGEYRYFLNDKTLRVHAPNGQTSDH